MWSSYFYIACRGRFNRGCFAGWRWIVAEAWRGVVNFHGCRVVSNLWTARNTLNFQNKLTKIFCYLVKLLLSTVLLRGLIIVIFCIKRNLFFWEFEFGVLYQVFYWVTGRYWILDVEMKLWKHIYLYINGTNNLIFIFNDIFRHFCHHQVSLKTKIKSV